MTFNPLSNQEKIEIQERTRAKQALKLCIIMMISDRDIHNNEINLIYSLINKNDFFNKLDISDEDIIALISELQAERVKLGLEELIKKYSKITNLKTRENVKIFITKVMTADGIAHDKELETLKILENIWNN